MKRFPKINNLFAFSGDRLNKCELFFINLGVLFLKHKVLTLIFEKKISYKNKKTIIKTQQRS